jgi:hypothetical protein
VGHVLYLSRQYERAIEAYRHTLQLDPISFRPGSGSAGPISKPADSLKP